MCSRVPLGVVVCRVLWTMRGLAADQEPAGQPRKTTRPPDCGPGAIMPQVAVPGSGPVAGLVSLLAAFTGSGVSGRIAR